jgi:hypothetical protein
MCSTEAVSAVNIEQFYPNFTPSYLWNKDDLSLAKKSIFFTFTERA